MKSNETKPRIPARDPNYRDAKEKQLSLWAKESSGFSKAPSKRNQSFYVASAGPRPSPVFDTYWRFAAERQAVFFRKLAGETAPLSADLILRRFKFTNAYRASDRVSQYLIQQVIYAGPQSEEELFFRILLFKTFNKIETWEALEHAVGPIRFATFDLDRYAAVLDQAMARGEAIYSGAYIMASGKRAFGHARKHRNHLHLLSLMMEDRLPKQIASADSMKRGFEMLRSYPTIGDFLAYQYVTDLNYSPLTTFSESEFVMPGPGALDGIAKCFDDLGEYDEQGIIEWTTERQEEEFEKRGLEFKSLWGRPLQLIDCQNLFCEISKYARVAHPEVEDPRGRTRIKQLYRSSHRPMPVWYPPKWGINDAIPRDLRAEVVPAE